jgi:hypothetical protein
MHSSKSCLRSRCRRSVGSDFQITSKVELFFHRCIFLLRVGDQEVNIPNKNRLQAFFFYSVLILDSHTAVPSVNQNPIHNAPLSPVIHLYENLSLNPVPLLFSSENQIHRKQIRSCLLHLHQNTKWINMPIVSAKSPGRSDEAHVTGLESKQGNE